MRCTILNIILIICFKFNSVESFKEDISTPIDNVNILENLEETVKKVATKTEKPEPVKKHIPENKEETFKGTITERPSKPEIDCVTKKCIAKCCPIGLYVHDKICVFPKVFKNFTFDITVPLYDVSQRRTGKHLPDVYNIVPGRFYDRDFNINGANDYHPAGHNYYLTENGILYEEVLNELKRWRVISPDNYCVDFLVRRGFMPVLRFWTIIPTYTPPRYDAFLSTGLLISCVFLLAVLVVYFLLPELRNLYGLIQMAYVVSLLGAFLLLAVMQMDQHSSFTCLGLTYSIYFFFLATFCWINVMSWDINSTFRRSHSNHRWRHSHRSKFYMYCAYAFGLPSAMTIMLIVLNHTDMRHLPWFVTPNLNKRGCFFGEEEKLLYLYIPMMILILFNFAMYIMTCKYLCRQYKNTAFLDSPTASSAATHRTQRKKFMIFVKLFSIMGLNWSLEVISSFFPGLYIWYISDLFNMLVGLFVFLITVGTQKSTRDKLIKRLQRRGEWSHFRFTRSRTSNSSSTTTTETDVTQETPLRQPSVCGKPSGPS